MTFYSEATGNVFQETKRANGKITLARIGYMQDRDDLGSFIEKDGIPITISEDWLGSEHYSEIVRTIGGGWMREKDMRELEILRAER